jgi:hypothetical protein
MPNLVKHALPLLVALLTLSGVSTSAKRVVEVVRVVNPLTPNSDNRPDSDFLRVRQRIGTHLKEVGPAPDLYKDPTTREGVRLARYRAGGSELKVWHLLPSQNQLWSPAGYPAVIFVHDGTSFSEEELQQARTFSEAGFVVVAPTFRGENGNLGAHELLFGELEDLVAATAHAAELPEVDKHKLVIWGHGLGGMLAALASLVPHLGVQFTGSSAGLRPISAFEVIRSPFETSEQERNLRVLGPNIHHMRTQHWACVAEQDPAVYEEATRLGELAARSNLPLHVDQVQGNRTTSRAVCTQRAIVLLLHSMRTWGSP